MPFQFYIGGRGIGKTYSVLKGHYFDFVHGDIGRMLYMRVTDREYAISCTQTGNPYKKINKNIGIDVQPAKIRGARGINAIMCKNGEEAECMGYMACLSSFSGVRGVDFSDVDLIYLDEFLIADNVIETPSMKKSGNTLVSAYETVARNRELLGQEPLRVICTANSVTLNSPILSIFGVIDDLVSMIRVGEYRRTIRDRGIYLELCEAIEVSEAKEDTVLYRAISASKAGEDYRKMSLKNNFADRAFGYLKKNVPLAEYEPLFNYEGCVVYRHKSKERYHVKRSNICVEYNMYDAKCIDALQARFKFDYLTALQERKITFDSVDDYYTLYKAMTERQRV